MPSGTGSGIVHSVTLTPANDGTLRVQVDFDSQGTAGDNWGASYITKVFCTQDGTTTYSAGKPMSTSRGSQTITASFAVVEGLLCEIGIYSEISGAVSASYWNIHITADLVIG